MSDPDDTSDGEPASPSLEDALERARSLSVAALADAVQSIGFECTHCGACCRSETDCGDDTAGGDADTSPHTATVFPDEVRTIRESLEDGDGGDRPVDWRDVARPMPFGLETNDDGTSGGETFEWALQTDACGDCAFYDGGSGEGGCTIHEDRPLICQTYPFSIALDGTTQPLGDAVDEAGLVRAHECEGLGRSMDRDAAESMARALRERAITELEEAIAVTDTYEPREKVDGVVVHDSEGAKRPDGRPVQRDLE